MIYDFWRAAMARGPSVKWEDAHMEDGPPRGVYLFVFETGGRRPVRHVAQ
jgi:hypothetical protein